MSVCVRVNVETVKHSHLDVLVTLTYEEIKSVNKEHLPQLLETVVAEYFDSSPMLGIMSAQEDHYQALHHMRRPVERAIYQTYGTALQVTGVLMTIPYQDITISQIYELWAFTRELSVPITTRFRYQGQSSDLSLQAQELVIQYWDPERILRRSQKSLNKLTLEPNNGIIILEYSLHMDDNRVLIELARDKHRQRQRNRIHDYETLISLLMLLGFLIIMFHP